MHIEFNYSEFLVEDFVWDEGYRQWVLSPDADSDLFWNEWLLTHPHKRDDLLLAKQIVKSIKVKTTEISDYEISCAIKNILLETNDSNQFVKAPFIQKHISSFNLSAAILIIALGFSFWFYNIGSNHSAITYTDLISLNNEKFIEQVNSTLAPIKVSLEDGSTVLLAHNAKISFPATFSGLNKRVIYLSGEATFEVTKDTSKPFYVYANGLVTKVLGTKFKIRSYDDEKKTTIEVNSGIVSVFSFIDKRSQDEKSDKKLNSLILTRNQKAFYSSEDKTLLASFVEEPIAVNEKVFNYTFSDTPIKQIFENIKEGYGIEIIYDEKLLANRTFTADLSQTSMYEKLSIICKAINTRYEITDGKIIIYPNS